MTREEAERAAATFEFPPFRARALAFTYHGKATNEWELMVWSESPRCWPTTFSATDVFLDFYACWQREHGVQSAG
jgi:hypothetical protein